MKLKTGFAALIGLFIYSSTFAQDTTVVQTLDFSDITKRRGWYVFPPDTGTYEKVLMYYTLKCDPQTTQDGFNCGEWDYTTYTNVYDYQGLDNPYYTVGSQYLDSILYVNNPTWTYYQGYQYFIVYDNTTSETDYTVGSGSVSSAETFPSTVNNGRSQYIWTASELSAAGLTAGSIDKLRVDVTALGSDLNDLTIRMKHTAFSTLSETQFENDAFTEVYHLNTVFGGVGIQTLELTSPFTWDGSSNIVVDFSFSTANATTANELNAEDVGFNAGVHTVQNDGYLDFDTPDYVEVPVDSIGTIDSFITVSFWQYGDPNVQPSNDYIFEGRDANGNRVINSHLPWGNGRVYWDCGNSGSGNYDRIDKAATASDYEGQWNHWAFVKDVSTGTMEIYLNGTLWHSGTGKTRTMDGITKFIIGGRALSSPQGAYDGNVNDFRVWKAALDQPTIEAWMHRDIDNTHPNYDDLMAYLKFDDGSGSSAQELNTFDGQLIGQPGWRWLKGWEQHRNLVSTTMRPNMTFVQGTYTTHIDSVATLDSMMNDPISVLEWDPVQDINVAGISFDPVDSIMVWESGWTYTYDQYGNKVDSIFHAPDNTLYNSYSAETVQIQNYVTPYGIGIDLGPNGFRWVYDVTEYEPWLHDTVDFRAGNQQELIDVKFLFIHGTPPRDLISADQIWNGDWNHGQIVDDVVLPAVDVDTDPTASQFVVRTRSTGHGFGAGNVNNCAEFCPKDHYLYVDGNLDHTWLNWKECSTNPVISQGGTWIYDRAGWCPATFGDTYNHDITNRVTPGQPVSVDYGMEPYSSGGGQGNYRIAVQFFQYGPPNFTNDAAIDDIISPNIWEYHNRYNPICGNAKVVLKNTGSATLTSADIKYRIQGNTYKTLNWTGSVDFLDTVHVVLPINDPNWWGPSNVFEVTVENTNGVGDEYANNNTMTSTFAAPPEYPTSLVIWYMPNNAPNETAWYVKDEQGNVIASKTSAPAFQLQRDTVDLTPGCYTFEVQDSDDDGLSFFANNDGNGYVRIRANGGAVLKDFEADFGRFIDHDFTVGYQIVDVKEEEMGTYMYVYPNPTTGLVNVELEGFDGRKLQIRVFDATGREVSNKTVVNPRQFMTQEIDITGENAGMYYIHVTDGLESRVERLIVE